MHKILYHNGVSLLFVGSTLLVEGTNPRLGFAYVTVGVILVIMDWYFIKDEKDSE